MPLEKGGPNRGKLLIGGLFVGLILGLGLVVLRALPDRVVRTRDDLEGLAVIGVIPRLDRTNLRRHTAMREQAW
ncbi:MAG: capsular polysaccharide biosynthesis protein [Planctomycetota bacterium]|jgi:capsular polysaccharide biosynthesis protein